MGERRKWKMIGGEGWMRKELGVRIRRKGRRLGLCGEMKKM